MVCALASQIYLELFKWENIQCNNGAFNEMIAILFSTAYWHKRTKKTFKKNQVIFLLRNLISQIYYVSRVNYCLKLCELPFGVFLPYL